MNKIKVLAEQTVLYGLTSVLGRVINFLLVPLYTATFMAEEYGKVILLYSYVAIINIIYTYGMETAFFRYASRDNGQRAYYLTGSSILITSLAFSLILYFFSDGLAVAIGLNQEAYIIRWLSLIVFFDAIVAIPFAKLRLDNRVVRFVFVRTSGIVITILFNIIFLVILPDIMADKYLGIIRPVVRQWYDPELGIGYIFLANLLGSLSLIVLLRKLLFSLKFTFNWESFKPMLIYAFPIMLTGLAGMLNDNLDKILLPGLLPDGFYPGKSGEAVVGVYGAAFKLSIFMLLAIQAFRFAGEPFFFSNADNKDAPELFAKVLHYFVVLSVVIMVAVGMNIEFIGRLFLRNPEYWDALYLVPILLLGKLLYGIYMNLSVWYKIKDKTQYGTYFSILGVSVTVIGNLLLVPFIGYLGSAISVVLCFLSMCIASYIYGKRYFPVPYDWKTIGIYLITTTGIVYFARLINFPNQFFGEIFAGILSVIVVIVVFVIEKKKFEQSPEQEQGNIEE